ncbi:hypothetical protein K2173_027072 [Erythroxylum novogranatense]|uniref:Glycosyltransferase n=1 Tax=Erythroxylum novogranatense TaxID=1862640 RepID=A0AAV8TY65_9ROSI|nr:hypothetical protein K2173_027072 [Erythroxylum novogranatense]
MTNSSSHDVSVDYHKPWSSACGHVARRPRFAISVFFVGAAISCFFLFKSDYAFRYLPGNSRSYTYEGLDAILANASMDDKTVILTTSNRAWSRPGSIVDLFLESYRIGNQTNRLLNHLVIISMDQEAHNRCLSIGIDFHCYNLKTQGFNFSTEAFFMTSEYLEMMWRRIDLLSYVLEIGYNFVFTDADILWFRDPFPRFHEDADFQIACDSYKGNSYDKNNKPNGGFTYVKSNPRTIKFYKFWYAARRLYPGKHDQDVLNKIKYHSFINRIGLQMRFLDTAFFGGFCEPSRDFNLVCTMHANCCVGLENKINDLKIILQDWKKFTSVTVPVPVPVRSPTWNAPQKCLTSFQTRHSP